MDQHLQDESERTKQASTLLHVSLAFTGKLVEAARNLCVHIRW
jgi:hypothetical protein